MLLRFSPALSIAHTYEDPPSPQNPRNRTGLIRFDFSVCATVVH